MSLSERSIKNLSECVPGLKDVFERVAESYPLEVIEGHRGEEEQNKLFVEGKTKVQFPDGKHNKMPSEAVDALPLPIDWNDREGIIFFAGFVIATALSMGIRLRWGGDWDSDKNLKEERFRDLVHFEFIEYI